MVHSRRRGDGDGAPPMQVGLRGLASPARETRPADESLAQPSSSYPDHTLRPATRRPTAPSRARISHTSGMATGLKVGGDVEQALENVGVPSYVLDNDGGRPVDQSGSRAACRRRSRSPLHLRRRARGQPPRPRAVHPEGARHLPGHGGDRHLVSTAGTRVAVEISAVPLRNGERVVGVFGLLEERPDDSPSAPPPHLTPRQVEVLRLLEQGRSTKQIAAELHLSPETVRNHVRRLFRALGVNTRLEAVAAARAAPARLVEAGQRPWKPCFSQRTTTACPAPHDGLRLTCSGQRQGV